MPFKVQEICDDNGIYYGQNVISNNMIVADRRKLLNGNSFILGVSGSGKSFTGKTGNSTGPHLHLEVRINGKYMDPEKYVTIPK